MVYLTPREYRLLRYAQEPNADLRRERLAAAAKIGNEAVSYLLTRLRKRGLIEKIKRVRYNRIVGIVPTFEFVLGKGYLVSNHQRRRQK